uniref:MSP domain-containing protein n=1 Tax=Panagrellus redivivus TaxID=6233 RepID=A0A7E4VE41_PANRE
MDSISRNMSLVKMNPLSQAYRTDTITCVLYLHSSAEGGATFVPPNAIITATTSTNEQSIMIMQPVETDRIHIEMRFDGNAKRKPAMTDTVSTYNESMCKQYLFRRKTNHNCP